MREVVSRRAVRSAALLEAFELRRLLSAVPDSAFGNAGVVHYSDALPASTQYDQIVSAKSANAIYTVAEISDAGNPLENQLIIRGFANNGAPLVSATASLPFSATDSLIVTDVVADASDNLFVAGSRFDVSENATIGFIVKLTASGMFDPSFAAGAGSISTPELAFNSQNVQLVVSGGTTYATYVTQDSIDGTIHTATTLAFDSSGGASMAYGIMGAATNPLPVGASVNEVLLDGSGLLLVGTTGPSAAVQSLFVGRLDGVGNTDTNFGTAGFGITAPTGYEIAPSGVARVGSNFFVAGTSTGGQQIVAKIAPDFTLDASFDDDGIVEINPATILFSPLDRSTRSLTADSAGSLYLAGITAGDDSADLAIVKLLPSTGALDVSFDDDGVYTLDEAEADVAIGLETTASGAVLATGLQIDGNSGEQSGLLVRLAEPVVVNNPPVVGAVNTAGSVNTGVSTTFSSSFSDTDSAGTFTVVWDFGDGNTQTVVVAAAGAISVSHAYATPGTKVVTVTVIDSSNNATTNSGTITAVTPPPPNTAPVVAIVTGPNSVNTNVAANFSSSFSDANGGDTFTVAWSYGDGHVSAPVVTAQGTVTTSHVYTVAGTYTVTVTISDGVNPAVTSSKTITITTPPPPVPYTIAAGQLSLPGTAGADSVELVKSGANYVLTVNGTPYTINSSLSSVVINGGNGADFIRVSTQITIPVSLIGGAGNDTLRGGSGDDVVIGDEGNDVIIGRDGQDLMIGGTGADHLIGREDADLLISGTTSLSSNLAALAAIQAEWTSNHNILIKLANVTGILPLPGRLNGNFYLTPDVTVFGDSNVDTLSGGDGSDLYYVSLFGINADIIRDNQNSYTGNLYTWVFGD